MGSDECKGDGCPFREECFSERAKAVAQGADIIVTNYHLLFAHLAVRRETGQDLVLPAHDLLILDEAHEAADIAGEFFGFTVSEHTFARLATAAADFGHKQLAGELRQEAGRLFERLADFARSPRYKKRLKAPGFASDAGVQRALRSLVAQATARAEDEARDQKERATARNVARSAAVAGARLDEGLQQADADKVYWLDVDPKGRAKLRAKPLPAGQKRERERRPERPRHALLHARGALCANAVHARVVLAERRRSRKRGGETQRPRRSLSEAAVKKCGVAFPRPRVNGSGTGLP